MPIFQVNDPQNVSVDGVHAGSVADVLDNHARDDGSRSALLDELKAWHGTVLSAHAAELKAAADSHAAELQSRDASAVDRQKQHAADLKHAADLQTAAIESLRTQHAADMEKRQAAHAEEIRRRHGAHTAAQAEFKRHRAMFDDLGGEQAWLATAPGKRAALVAMKAKAEADLAAHDAAAAPTAPATTPGA